MVKSTIFNVAVALSAFLVLSEKEGGTLTA
jgi:hypothetical protein